MRFVTDDANKRDLSSREGLQVIACGLPRCATSSLQYALENELGFGPCMHMAYIAPHADLLKICYQAEIETDKEKRQKLLHKVFDGYCATADFPGMAFIDDLTEMYPDAKLILNMRDSPEKWASSITETLRFFSSKTYLFLTYLMPTDYWHWKIHQGAKQLWQRRFGIGSIFVTDSYNKHNQWVREVAKRNGKELLEWQPQNGWEPICEFLGKPVPDKKFPHLNDKLEIRKVKHFLIARGLAAWGLLFLVPTVGFWAYSWLKN
jgi:hypothetical protein